MSVSVCACMYVYIRVLVVLWPNDEKIIYFTQEYLHFQYNLFARLECLFSSFYIPSNYIILFFFFIFSYFSSFPSSFSDVLNSKDSFIKKTVLLSSLLKKKKLNRDLTVPSRQCLTMMFTETKIVKNYYATFKAH